MHLIINAYGEFHLYLLKDFLVIKNKKQKIAGQNNNDYSMKMFLKFQSVHYLFIIGPVDCVNLIQAWHGPHIDPLSFIFSPSDL